MKPLLFLLLAGLLLTGCGQAAPSTPAAPAAPAYRQISQDEAMEMMRRDDGHIVLDVRRADEYAAGHIPGAVLLPNEDIDTAPPGILPDLDQIILIYCRSGNRSKQAAQKLAGMGYTNIYEFGGINTWPGEIVTEEAPSVKQTASVSFDSFDGGGPEFTVRIADPEIVSCAAERRYHRADHDEIDGAGYTVTFTFTGLKPGETEVTISARSPIADNFDALYAVRVDAGGAVALEEVQVEDET
jgi:rhodanese-related sulfurtransferase